MSISRHFQELEISYGTLKRISHLDLHQRQYKGLFTLPLKPAIHTQRRTYVGWGLEHRWMLDKLPCLRG